METEQKQEEDQKKNNYALSNSMAMAVTIDGLIELALPFVLGMPGTKETSAKEVMAQAVLAAAKAIPPAMLAYYLRTLARNEGHEYVGGVIGNYGKYAAGGSKESIVSVVAGGSNGLFYEICNNYKICSEGYGSYISPIVIEVFDQMLQAGLNYYIYANGGLSLSTTAKIGAVVGVAVAITGNLIYANTVSLFKNAADYVDDCLSYDESTVDISFLNQTPSENIANATNPSLSDNSFGEDIESKTSASLVVEAPDASLLVVETPDALLCNSTNSTLMGAESDHIQV